MPRRAIDLEGATWFVEPAGRLTQYARDEFALLFTKGQGADAERRVARLTPLTTKDREVALATLADDDLRALIRRSQPARMSPETGYAR